ncbi:Vacuolar protein sorting-associated protein 11-like [Stylophora pistillata]|uniref:Vacuolar protein sorting-associated protein 11-like n=1 Tax=Stylophora pistillata TaxID=50429 RepID=A0A2B4RFW3_STYPI|nr:Vacuolar protein sorting-associated protein 11-like [Stylophora pistillata]
MSLATWLEDEVEGIDPIIRVWNLDKIDKYGNPVCCCMQRLIPGNKPVPVSCLALMENLTQMAVGFADGTVLVYKGDITRDRHTKQRIVHHDKHPVTGLAFKQTSDSVILFVVTTETVLSYNTSAKDRREVLDAHGCELRCSVMSDASQENQFIVARKEALYFYQVDGRGPCLAFEGEKQMVTWWRGYLVVVSKDNKQIQRPAVGGSSQPRNVNVVTVYDIQNKFIAFTGTFQGVIDVICEWGSLFVITMENKARYDIDHALVLAQMHHFKAGILYLYEKAKLYQQILHYHMEQNEYSHVIDTCKKYGESNIDRGNLMSPLLVLQNLAYNSTATLAVVKDYIIHRLQMEDELIANDERYIRQYREETEKMRNQIKELKTSCFEGYAESDNECPICAPENRKVLDIIRQQEQAKDLHEQFHHQLERAADGFSVVAEYYGRGVFNKYLRKCKENSMENMHTDVRVKHHHFTYPASPRGCSFDNHRLPERDRLKNMLRRIGGALGFSLGTDSTSVVTNLTFETRLHYYASTAAARAIQPLTGGISCGANDTNGIRTSEFEGDPRNSTSKIRPERSQTIQPLSEGILCGVDDINGIRNSGFKASLRKSTSRIKPERSQAIQPRIGGILCGADYTNNVRKKGFEDVLATASPEEDQNDHRPSSL